MGECERQGDRGHVKDKIIRGGYEGQGDWGSVDNVIGVVLTM